jgi:hypothetical protein
MELCQYNSVKSGSKMVLYKGFEYEPLKIIIWFDKDGKTKNTGFLVRNGMAVQADINDLEEIDGQGD